MAVGDAHVSRLSHTSTNTTFFRKPPTTVLTCFRAERRKFRGKKVCLNQVSNSQPPGHESDMLTTEPPRWAEKEIREIYEIHLIRLFFDLSFLIIFLPSVHLWHDVIQPFQFRLGKQGI